ncbi:MAG: hypothetical protein ACYC2P_12520 [Paludibacteraceae bacterium]
MKIFKQLFSNWDAGRYLKLVLGIILGVVYAFDGQGFYLLFSVFFLVQAVLNMGCGCSTGNCATTVSKNQKTDYHFENLNTNKKDV